MHFGKLICTGFQLEGPNPLGHGPISSVRYLYFVCILLSLTRALRLRVVERRRLPLRIDLQITQSHVFFMSPARKVLT